MTRSNGVVVRLAAAIVTAATRLLPGGFRGSFGQAIREAFRDEAVDAYRHGGAMRVLRVTLTAIADVIASRGDHLPRTRGSLIATLRQDTSYALRLLRREPGFTAGAALMLALGVGCNAAIFTLLNAALLRPLPYPEADRLVRVWGHRIDVNEDSNPVNPNDAADWRRGAGGVESLGVASTTTQPLTGIGEPVPVPVAFVSSGYLETLRIQPAAGRLFGPEHDLPGRETEVVVTDGFWREVLGGDRAVLGRTIRLADVPCTIIGVLPPEFVSPGMRAGAEPRIWRPLVVAPDNRGGHFTSAIARLKPGISLSQAQAQINAVAERLSQEYPATNLGQRARLQPLRDAIAGDTRTAVLLLMAGVAVVLLIACTNVANLLLARATARRREFAVRGALGASRGRLVRQLLTESLLIASLSAAAGAGVGILALNAFPQWLADQWPTAIQISMDARVLAFTVALSLATVVIFGLVPAVVASRNDLRGVLAATSPGAGGGTRRFQSALVVIETALALVLLVAAALLTQSLVRLQRVDPGFVTTGTLTFRLTLPRTRYPEPERRNRFLEEVIERIASQPGVRAAGGVNTSPMSNRNSCDSFGLADRPPPPEGQEPCAEVRVATPGYFTAMGIPLVAGRPLQPSDVRSSLRVIVVSQSMAQRYWPAGNALGQRFKWGSVTADTDWLTIVGIVGDVKHFGLAEAAPDEVYMPLTQSSSSAFTIAVQTESSALDVRDRVREIVAAMDPSLPLMEMSTTREAVERSVALPVFRTRLLSVFALLALVLAVAGVYSMMTFHVAQRRREIGIRLALGATTSSTNRMIVAGAGTSLATGCAIGIAAAIPLMRFTREALYGVTPASPLAYVFPAILLVTTGVVASYAATRRATRVNPLEIIRVD